MAELEANKDWLIWARESVYFDKSTVAHKMNITEETLTNWENTGKINYNSLVKLSEIYKQSPLIFFNKNKPTYSKPIPDYRTVNNKKIQITPEIAFEIRDALIRRENILTIEEENSLKISPFGIECASKKNECLDNIKSALEISKARLTEFSLEDWITKIEQLNVLIFHFYNISPKDLRGYAIYNKKLPIIGINNQETDNGKKFTLFHELAHLVLQKDGLSNFESYNIKNNLEVICNSIAAEILVPEEYLNEFITKQKISIFTDSENIKKLSKFFKVSEEVIIRRLLTLNYINKTEYQKYKEELNNYIFFTKKAKKSINTKRNFKSKKTKYEINKKEKDNRKATTTIKQNGKFYIKYLFNAYENDIIDDLDLTDNLNQSIDVINSIHEKINRGKL